MINKNVRWATLFFSVLVLFTLIFGITACEIEKELPKPTFNEKGELVATMRMQSRVMKASSPAYE